MRFINIQTFKLLFHLGSCENAISTVAVSPNGRHMAAVMDSGSINVYSIHSLTQEFNKVTVQTAYKVLRLHVFIFCMYLQPLSSQVAVVSGGEDDRERSKLKMRVRSDVNEKSAKRTGRQSKAKIPTGFPVDEKEVRTTYTDVFFHICMMSAIRTKPFPSTVKTVCLSLE